MENQDAGWRGKFAGFALGLSIFSVLWFAAAAFGSKFGLWSWQFGLGKMTVAWGPLICMAALGLSVIAIVIALIKAPRKQALMLALGALLISGLTFGRLAGMAAGSAALPPIHDIQTNWADPIRPTEGLLAKRRAAGAMNAIEDAPVVAGVPEGRWPGMNGRKVSELQEENEYDPGKHKSRKDAAYPKLDSVVSPLPYLETFEAVRAMVKTQGWEMVTANAETGQIEATQTSMAFGFKDDVMIRVRPVDGVASVDVRSTSRVGLSDLGANSKRVGNLLEDIRRALGPQAK